MRDQPDPALRQRGMITVLEQYHFVKRSFLPPGDDIAARAYAAQSTVIQLVKNKSYRLSFFDHHESVLPPPFEFEMPLLRPALERIRRSLFDEWQLEFEFC